MTRAAVYLRVSLDQTGEHLAVERQREDCLALAAARGWEVAEEYVDNSISASDARKARPAYSQMCADYAAGKFDALLCYDLDRLTRQPRQLEDWIDAAEQRGLLLVTANGEADLSTDGGRMYARIKAAVARAEIERKAARQSRAQRQRAQMGRPAKGTRCTGYTTAGDTVPAEKAVVRRIFDEFMAGNSLKGIAAGLQRDGVTTRRGGQWSSSSVSSILRNARYAGRSIYKGQDVGAGEWEAFVTEAEFATVQARLHSPERVANKGDRERKHLGSGLYTCECGLPIRSSSGIGPGTNRYTCRHACFYRTGPAIDEFVLAVVHRRLAMPDLRDLLVKPADEGRLKALTAELATLRQRVAQVEADYDADLIDGLRFKTKTDKLRAEMDAVQRGQAALVDAGSESGILTAEDPVAAFDAAPLPIQQRVIRFLCTITLHRQKQGRKGFDPDSVTIEWR